MQQSLPVQQLVERLGREELNLKNVGAHALAAGVRNAVALVLRMAHEEPQPIEPSDE